MSNMDTIHDQIAIAAITDGAAAQVSWRRWLAAFYCFDAYSPSFRAGHHAGCLQHRLPVDIGRTHHWQYRHRRTGMDITMDPVATPLVGVPSVVTMPATTAMRTGHPQGVSLLIIKGAHKNVTGEFFKGKQRLWRQLRLPRNRPGNYGGGAHRAGWRERGRQIHAAQAAG